MPEQIQPRTECKPCRWFTVLYNPVADESVCMCRLRGHRDPTPCGDYEREPGSDDE